MNGVLVMSTRRDRSPSKPCRASVIAALALSISGDYQTYHDLVESVEEIVGHTIKPCEVWQAAAYLRKCGARIDRCVSIRRGCDPQILQRIAIEMMPNPVRQLN